MSADPRSISPVLSMGESSHIPEPATAGSERSANKCNAGDAWEVLELLAGLVRKSLVMMEEQAPAGRYRLLETVRQYAMERLQAAGETEAARDRHLNYFVALAEASEGALSGSGQEARINLLEQEHDNLRGALHWARQRGDNVLGLRLVCALTPFWRLRTHFSEGRRWLEVMLNQVEEASAASQPAAKALYASALRMAGVFAFEQGDYARAGALAERSLRVLRELGDTRGIAMVLNNLGNVADQTGDYARSQALFDESLRLLRDLGDRPLVMRSLNNHGIAARNRGDYPRARSLLIECLVLARELGDSDSVARACTNLSTVAHIQGEYGAAKTLAEESLGRQRALGNKTGMASALRNLGTIAFEQRDFALAWERYNDCLSLGREVGDKSSMAVAHCSLGAIAYQQGDHALAVKRYDESLALYQEMGQREGVALVLANLARLRTQQGDQARATALYRQSVDQYRELGDRRGLAICLEGMATLARMSNQFELVAEFSAAAAALRKSIGAPMPPVDCEQHENVLSATRLALGGAAFCAAWDVGSTMSLARMFSCVEDVRLIATQDDTRVARAT